MVYTAAPTICSTTGRGDAKNRALHRAIGSYRARWCGVTSPAVVIEKVTIEFPMRQAATRPLVHAIRFPATLLDLGWMELGASPAGRRLRSGRAPLRPECIAPPRQRTPHWDHDDLGLVLKGNDGTERKRHGDEGQQRACPAGQDAGTERGDPKQQRSQEKHGS